MGRQGQNRNRLGVPRRSRRRMLMRSFVGQRCSLDAVETKEQASFVADFR